MWGRAVPFPKRGSGSFLCGFGTCAAWEKGRVPLRKEKGKLAAWAENLFGAQPRRIGPLAYCVFVCGHNAYNQLKKQSG